MRGQRRLACPAGACQCLEVERTADRHHGNHQRLTCIAAFQLADEGLEDLGGIKPQRAGGLFPVGGGARVVGILECAVRLALEQLERGCHAGTLPSEVALCVPSARAASRRAGTSSSALSVCSCTWLTRVARSSPSMGSDCLA